MGPIVQMIGGPLDGTERHRDFSTSKHERWVCYVHGYPTGTHAPVHVYEAHGSPHAPFLYAGIGARQIGDSPYPVSTYLRNTPTEPTR